MDDDEEKPPVAQLSDEEKKQWFRKPIVTDMTSWALSTSFMNFSIPTQDEGFDDVRYQWYRTAKCSEYIKEWIINKKLTTRVEDIQPSETFTQHWISWQQQVLKWRQRQNERREQVKKAAAQKAEDTPNGDAEKVEKSEDSSGAPSVEETGKVQDEKEDAVDKDKVLVDGAKESVDDEELDVFGVANVCDVGNGEPLFGNFTFEDWALLSLRFELHSLVHAFRRDVNDPERAGIHVDHLLFYYNKYFLKSLNAKSYGVDTYEELG